MKRSSSVLISAVLVLAALPVAAVEPVRNVIVMVPDGCDDAVVTAARWFKGSPLAVDGIRVGALTTYMADSVITDSAAAATAFASGVKTSDGFIGVGPRVEGLLSTMPMPAPEVQYAPFATALEAAKLVGKATGIVATSRITHATPAAYVSHNHSRNNENDIMEQIVYQNLDVVFGGGKRHLLPTSAGGKRTDGADLTQVLASRGYQMVETADAMAALSTRKVFGMFASSHMDAELDRRELHPQQPTLADMTAKAIELLSQDPDGFFLMVEGSQVDWAGHANDPIYMITDFIAFDDAVKVALDFATQDASTLVLVFPDHNTGGMKIGNAITDNGYTAVQVEDLVGPLQGMKLTGFGLATKIGSDTSAENIKAQVREWWGIELTDDDIAGIQAYVAGGLTLDYAIPRLVSERYTVIGWTTHGHNGEDVPLWAYGPGRPIGLVDNTEIAVISAQAAGGDLAATTNQLFVEVGSHFANAAISTADPENPVVRVGSCTLHANTNMLVYEPLGLALPLEGVVVYAPITGKAYVSRLGCAIVEALNGLGTASVANAVDVERTVESLRHRLALPELD